ncbi:hypothetical protein MBO_02852 [Moraxella bovoculi 237]|uniref:Uncharacterized protein n=1 Tax=Moraxella bovoculi 237 TaxID=743974 RepID=A0A066UNA0_9GAMM|nr:hypothetical protein MBO_02852 [Moraxella bovoculi 237]
MFFMLFAIKNRETTLLIISSTSSRSLKSNQIAINIIGTLIGMSALGWFRANYYQIISKNKYIAKDVMTCKNIQRLSLRIF